MRQASGKGRTSSSERETFVIRIASAAAVGIKEASSRANIRQAADLVNGLMFAGLLVEKNTPPEGPQEHMAFVDRYCETEPRFRDVIAQDAFENAEEVKRIMASHEIGVADQSPSEMLINIGLSAEGIIGTIGSDYDLSRRERLDVISFAIILAVMANTAPEYLDKVLAGVRTSLATKAAAWNESIPSDAEMFGDDEDEEDS